MGILKDLKDDSEYYVTSYKIKHFLSPKAWLSTSRRRRERADRGWSDYDAWNAGDHIAKMVAEMLQHLNDNGSTDWKLWFKQNAPNDKYKNLQSVIDDINNYLEFQRTSWADEFNSSVEENKEWLEEDGSPVKWTSKKTGKKANKRQITAAINRYHKQEEKLYKKASDAMQFFGRNFRGFWD